MASPKKNNISILEEVAALSAPVDDHLIDSTPDFIVTELAARQRVTMRNDAVVAHMQMRVAAASGRPPEEQKRFSERLAQLIKEVAELDRLYPGAKARMVEMEEDAQKAREPNAQGG